MLTCTLINQICVTDLNFLLPTFLLSKLQDTRTPESTAKGCVQAQHLKFYRHEVVHFF